MSIRKYERRILKHKAKTIGVKESAYVHAIYQERRKENKTLKRTVKEMAGTIKEMSEQKVEA